MASSPSPDVRRARWAVAALFLTNGAIFANVLPRLPEIKAALGLDNSAYGLAIAAFPAGAILAGLGAGTVIRRLGSGRAAVVGTLLTGLGVLAAGLAPTAALLALALGLAGACDAITDVAQNSHGLRVQRRYGRSILNSFHAVWSIGAVIGGTMAALAIALHLPLGVHLGISALLWAAVAITAGRSTLPGGDAEPGEESEEEARTGGAAPAARVPARTLLMLTALVILAIAGTLVEDSGNSWAALFLHQELGAPGATAALGYIALVGMQFIGRLLGDGLVDRFGQRTVARTGGLIIALGMGMALALPSVPTAIAGFALAGLGSATLVPAAMSEADELPGLRHGTGLTIVSWLMRLGFLASPPLVGLVADHAGLRAGLLVVPVAGIAVIAAAGVLGRKPVSAGPGAGTPLVPEQTPPVRCAGPDGS